MGMGPEAATRGAYVYVAAAGDKQKSGQWKIYKKVYGISHENRSQIFPPYERERQGIIT